MAREASGGDSTWAGNLKGSPKEGLSEMHNSPGDSPRDGNMNFMCGSVQRLGKLKMKSRECYSELEKISKQIWKHFHSKVKGWPCVPPGSSDLIPVTSFLLIQHLYIYFQEPRNPERFIPPGTCLPFLSCQGLLILDFCLLASHSCFANSAICFLPPTRKKPGHDFRRPPQVPASGVCALCCHWDLLQECFEIVISGILETCGKRQE